MDVVSLCPFRVASMVWQRSPSAFALTFAVKATYDLLPIESRLADHQEHPNEEDDHWDDDPARSLSASTDLVPFKPRAEVLLVGHAYAPRGEPVRSLAARLTIAGADKTIEMFCDRTVRRDGELREGARFVKMPLRYERASAGEDGANPVGIRLDAQDLYGVVTLPNLQPPGLSISGHPRYIPPVGFGPIAPSWPDRLRLAGRRGAPSPRDWHAQPLPNDMDPAFFNSAPRDQQVDALRDDERIVLENLHPQHPRLVTSLPGLRPRAFTERAGAPQEIGLRADTLWIDTDRQIVTLTWRGQVSLERPDQAGRIGVLVERPGERLTPADVERILLGALLHRPTAPLPPAAEEIEPEELEVEDDVGSGTILVLDDAPQAATLPFASNAEGFARARREPASTGLGGLPFSRDDGSMPLPPAPASYGGLSSFAAPQAPDAAPPPPSMVYAPFAADESAPRASATSNSPWAGGIGSPRHEEARAPLAAHLTSSSDRQDVARAAVGGALQASNAAVQHAVSALPPEEPEPPRVLEAKTPAAQRTGEIVKLLWFDPACVKKVRKEPRWRVTLAELELKLLEADDGREEDAGDDRDRRDVFEVLARGSAVDVMGVGEAVRDAIDEDGKFEPPLVLVAGDLELPLDALETLKATVTAVKPLVADDKRLADLVRAVEDLSKTPWVEGSSATAERFTRQLKDAFAQGKRMLEPSELESSTERLLLERRAYQKRTLFGKSWIRALLHAPGGGEPIPTYVPDHLANELPMFPRMKAKVLGEVDMREDQKETHAHAIRVVALGRLIPR